MGEKLGIRNKPRNYRNEVVLANKDFKIAIVSIFKEKYEHKEARY